MAHITEEEMQQNLSAYLKRVEEGETLVVVRSGQPIAEVKPISTGMNADDLKRLSRKYYGCVADMEGSGVEILDLLFVRDKIQSILDKSTPEKQIPDSLYEQVHNQDNMNLKIAFLRQRVEMFESRWNMKFEMFAARCESGTLNQDAYSYQVEDDFWAWEEAETLLQHYESLQARWM